jgi:hypothetical protein
VQGGLIEILEARNSELAGALAAAEERLARLDRALSRNYGNSSTDSAARVKPGRAACCPSVAVRGKATVTPTARQLRTPSAMCPWTPRHSGLQRDKVTHGRTEKNGPPAARIRS